MLRSDGVHIVGSEVQDLREKKLRSQNQNQRLVFCNFKYVCMRPVLKFVFGQKMHTDRLFPDDDFDIDPKIVPQSEDNRIRVC